MRMMARRMKRKRLYNTWNARCPKRRQRSQRHWTSYCLLQCWNLTTLSIDWCSCEQVCLTPKKTKTKISSHTSRRRCTRRIDSLHYFIYSDVNALNTDHHQQKVGSYAYSQSDCNVFLIQRQFNHKSTPHKLIKALRGWSAVVEGWYRVINK